MLPGCPLCFGGGESSLGVSRRPCGISQRATEVRQGGLSLKDKGNFPRLLAQESQIHGLSACGLAVLPRSRLSAASSHCRAWCWKAAKRLENLRHWGSTRGLLPHATPACLDAPPKMIWDLHFNVGAKSRRACKDDCVVFIYAAAASPTARGRPRRPRRAERGHGAAAAERGDRLRPSEKARISEPRRGPRATGGQRHPKKEM